MLLNFRDDDTEKLYNGRRPGRIPSDGKGAVRKLFLIDTATRLDDLRVPPGNKLEALAGDRAGQYPIRVNDQWRVCFEWFDGNAYNVEFVDYHG